MLRSSNPILSKKDAFTPAAPRTARTRTRPYARRIRTASSRATPTERPCSTEGRMTLDDVITKTAVMMGVLVISAALSWVFIPVAVHCRALILSAWSASSSCCSSRSDGTCRPPLVFLYAAIEGVFIGMFSKMFEQLVPGHRGPGRDRHLRGRRRHPGRVQVLQHRVTPKFRQIVIIATIAFAVAHAGELHRRRCSARRASALTGPVSCWPSADLALGVVLAVLNLVLDFDYIEQGIAIGAPAKESWRGGLRADRDHGLALRRDPAAACPTSAGSHRQPSWTRAAHPAGVGGFSLPGLAPTAASTSPSWQPSANPSIRRSISRFSSRTPIHSASGASQAGRQLKL